MLSSICIKSSQKPLAFQCMQCGEGIVQEKALILILGAAPGARGRIRGAIGPRSKLLAGALGEVPLIRIRIRYFEIQKPPIDSP